jgi:hypothetical protein
MKLDPDMHIVMHLLLFGKIGVTRTRRHCWTPCSGFARRISGDRLGGDEENACTRSFEVQRIIKVHLLVLQLFHWWGLLGLCPFRDEI